MPKMPYDKGEKSDEREHKMKKKMNKIKAPKKDRLKIKY